MYSRFIPLFLLITFSYVASQAQFTCGIANIEAKTQQYPSFGTSKARIGKFRIAINPVVVSSSNGIEVFSDRDVLLLIERANQYFAPINYEFYIVNNGIKRVNNDEFNKFQAKNENELRTLFDVDFAINLYIVSTISLPNKDILSGFASLPSLNSASNRIMLSYFDRNEEDFKTLVEKVFPHELGHYFGLLHTFQDSNDEEISKREVVTRGPSANCSSTGDFTCDTPADPYERLTSIANYNCQSTLPSTLQDVYGQVFTPMVSNIMSYHTRCGNVFTAEQYERMKSAASIRFSPKAEYQLIQQEENSIVINKISKKVFCPGETLEATWEAFGFYFEDNKFNVQLINSNNNTTISLNEAVIIKNSVFINLPSTIEAGQNYRLQIFSSNPVSESYISDNFEIKSIGKVTLLANKNIIDKGETLNIQTSITGNGPWDLKYSNGLEFDNVSQNQLSFSFSPSQDTTISVVSASNSCGSLQINPSVRILVAQPNIVLNETKTLEICESSLVEINAKGLKSSDDNFYQGIIKGSNNILIRPKISEDKIVFNLPQEIEAGTNLTFYLKGEGFGDFSEPITLLVKPKPDQPFVQSPISFCFEEKNAKLKAEGENLKWYNNSNFSSTSIENNINTNNAGNYFYYVSQTNQDGCESEKSKIEVVVKSQLIVTISGDNSILKGDSTQLRIEILGEAPAELKLNDGTILSLSSNESFYAVSPENSFDYVIKEAKNGCGIGIVQGIASVTVQLPLSSQSFLSENNVFPNPTSGTVNIDNASEKIIMIDVFDIRGHLIENYKELSQGFLKVKLPSIGMYFLRLTLKDGSAEVHKVLVLK